MSKKRQEPAVRSLGLTLPDGHRIKPHAHDWPQVIYATRGIISVTTSQGLWLAPPMRALWLAAGLRHELHMQGVVEMRTLYLRPDIAPPMQKPCCVIAVPPLLRELIISIVADVALHESKPSDAARLRLLSDLLTVIPEHPLELPIPADARARKVADKVLARIDSDATLPQLARATGASHRTIERLFIRETGMTFGRWRQQARLLESLRLLGANTPVITTALKVGYASPSAFVAAFKTNFGITPAQYYR